MPQYPKVSCACVTYGRTDLLNESVYSFLIQDYPGEKELTILNDLAELEISGSFKDVVIYNEEKRYESLGEKRNACVEKCTGDIICVWDDDDIFLPNRISSSALLMRNRPYVLPNKHVYYSDEEMRLVSYGVKAQALFYKSLWKEMGGYPALNRREDSSFENTIRTNGKFNLIEIDSKDVSYIYRWRITGSYLIFPHEVGRSLLLYVN